MDGETLMDTWQVYKQLWRLAFENHDPALMENNMMNIRTVYPKSFPGKALIELL